MNSLHGLAAKLDAFVDFVGRTVAWTCLVLVAVMATNVLLRYLFRTGSVWSQELEWHLMSPLVLFGMSYCLLRDGHLRVDVLFVKFGARTQVMVDLVSAILGAMFSLIVVHLSWKYVLQSWSIGEGSPDPGGFPYRYALKAFIPAGFVLLFVQSAAAVIKNALNLVAVRE
ncbi:MAG TPA: TRAP transporter small permease subunit [Alphaproteobacteria bacterium]|nr:TRAP transporter small permease subunit [Alphaproteobacteria bacterium]